VPRIFLAAVLVAAETLVFGVPCLLFALLDRSGRVAHAIVRLWARLVLRNLGIRVEVEGPAFQGPAVYAANHASALDVPILFGYLPVSGGFRILHKHSLYLVPVLGWYLYLGGHIGIDRGNPFRARRSLAAAVRRIAAGTSVVAFPEGTRAVDERLRPFKRGSLVMAIQAGVPVVPVSLVGVKKLVPAGILTLRPGRVVLRVHPPLPTAGRTSATATELAEEVRRIVAKGCGQEQPA
jgi:1-acyl-sn-glycerol-3-phosphate acyltransferase